MQDERLPLAEQPSADEWRDADFVEDYDSEPELTPPACGGSHDDIVRLDD